MANIGVTGVYGSTTKRKCLKQAKKCQRVDLKVAAVIYKIIVSTPNMIIHIKRKWDYQ